MSKTYVRVCAITDTGNIPVDGDNNHWLEPGDYEILEVIEEYDPDQVPIHSGEAGNYIAKLAKVKITLDTPIEECKYRFVHKDGHAVCMYNSPYTPTDLTHGDAYPVLFCIQCMKYSVAPKEKPPWTIHEIYKALTLTTEIDEYAKRVIELASLNALTTIAMDMLPYAGHQELEQIVEILLSNSWPETPEA